MRILVLCHRLELGGSQINSIELAARLSTDYGHEVMVYGAPGPALELVREHGLRYFAAPWRGFHPSLAIMTGLRRIVSTERIDLVHAWEWPQCLDAFYGLQFVPRVPVMGSNMSMAVTRFLPRCLPMTYGTPALVDEARRWHRAPVSLLEPPVDVHRNRPGAVHADDFRRQHQLNDGAINVVIVSRLTSWLKLESLERSIEAIASLAHERPIRLLVVGGGPAYDQLAARARRVNDRLGRDVIVLTGPMTDPRPAYASASLVIGMGSSILRGLAFAKPCIVVGEGGFSEAITPETSKRFLQHGFYGRGNGDQAEERIGQQVLSIVDSAERVAELGAYGRRLVEERFSLEAGAAALDAFYHQVMSSRISRGRVIAEGIRSALHRTGSWAVPDRLKRRILALG